MNEWLGDTVVLIQDTPTLNFIVAIIITHIRCNQLWAVFYTCPKVYNSLAFHLCNQGFGFSGWGSNLYLSDLNKHKILIVQIGTKDNVQLQVCRSSSTLNIILFKHIHVQ